MGLSKTRFFLRAANNNKARIITGVVLTGLIEGIWELIRYKQLSEEQVSPTARALIDTAIAVAGVIAIILSICCRSKPEGYMKRGEGMPLISQDSRHQPVTATGSINAGSTTPSSSSKRLQTGTANKKAEQLVIDVQAALDVASFLDPRGLPISANDAASLVTTGAPIRRPPPTHVI